MVLDAFAEAILQACVAPVGHANAQILPLNPRPESPRLPLKKGGIQSSPQPILDSDETRSL
jgi:hypothetical protein